MAKMSLNMTRKFKITDFLLGFGFRSRRLFCRYCYVTWVYRFSYMYVKRSLRALRWISIGGAVEPFCHTYFWNTYSDVFRPGFLSNMWSLGQIEHCMAELQQHLFPWRDIEIWQDATDTPSDENSRSSQFNVTKGFRLQWPILVFIRLNLWEEFVKVWHLQMAKMSLNMTRKFKITDFLLGFGFRSRRLFCRYCYVTWVYRFSYMYVKRSSRRTLLNIYRWRCRAILPHLLLKPISDVNFHQFWCVCKVSWLFEHV